MVDAARVVGSARVASRRTVATRPANAAEPSSPDAVNLGYLDGLLSFHLRLAHEASARALARQGGEEPKPARFPALAIIQLNPGISQSALGRAIARDKSTVSPLIRDLQRNGFISREPSPRDRRSVTLVLTRKGERILAELHARASEHEDDLARLIGPARAQFIDSLEAIAVGLGVPAEGS